MEAQSVDGTGVDAGSAGDALAVIDLELPGDRIQFETHDRADGDACAAAPAFVLVTGDALCHLGDGEAFLPEPVLCCLELRFVPLKGQDHDSASVSVDLGMARQTLMQSVNSLTLETATIIRTIFRIPGFIAPIMHEMSGQIDEISAKKMYRLVISSSNGNIFKNGDISTTLSATVFSWDEDVTDELDPNQFVWTRVSDNPEADINWNHDHFGGTKTIEITTDDVVQRATFFCDLIDTTTRQSLLG